jgi:hypothetical protein
MRGITLVCFVLMFSLAACAQKRAGFDAVLGDWNGESKCASSDSNCHDEIVVYHVTRSKKDAAKINISMDKKVNGKPDFMGESDYTFDAEKITLTTEVPFSRINGKGVWVFKVDGNKMDGTATVFPGAVLFRRIHVERKKNDK